MLSRTVVCEMQPDYFLQCDFAVVICGFQVDDPFDVTGSEGEIALDPFFLLGGRPWGIGRVGGTEDRTRRSMRVPCCI